jgi:hypothetical protein
LTASVAASAADGALAAADVAGALLDEAGADAAGAVIGDAVEQALNRTAHRAEPAARVIERANMEFSSSRVVLAGDTAQARIRIAARRNPSGRFVRS